MGDSVFTSILSSLCQSLQTSGNRKEEVTGLVMSGPRAERWGKGHDGRRGVGGADVEQTLCVEAWIRREE